MPFVRCAAAFFRVRAKPKWANALGVMHAFAAADRAGMNPRTAKPSLLKQAHKVGSLRRQAWCRSRRLQPAACAEQETNRLQNVASHPNALAESTMLGHGGTILVLKVRVRSNPCRQPIVSG